MFHDKTLSLLDHPEFQAAFRLQVGTLETFYRLAGSVAGRDCPLGPPPPSSAHIKRNFFSTFFLVVTRRMVGDSGRLPLYAMVNQSMRAWVTACDNLLDDEYKEIFPFVAARGNRMRSVLTLLIADRVLTEYVAERFADTELLARVGRVSLAALVPSALQESEEESRPVPVLAPQVILDGIHVRKTGDLFMAPLALPLALEEVSAGCAESARAAVRRFGLACQVLDDIKDMPDDMAAGRHNLLVSILCHGVWGSPGLPRRLREEPRGDWTAWERFPEACAAAWEFAAERFNGAFDALASLGIPLGRTEREDVVALMCELLKVPAPAAMVIGEPG